MNKESQLCYVQYVGTDIDNNNIYELLFTSNADEFWGENFDYMPCCLCSELIPNEDGYETVKVMKSSVKLTLIQDSCCHSMQDCMDGIVALAWEDISDYSEYPEEGRLVFIFGEDYSSVERKLAVKNIVLTNKKKEEKQGE